MRAAQKTGRRIAAAVLCLVMALSMTGGASLGEASSSGGGGETLCNHVHDATCGYAAPSLGTPCDRACTDINGDGTVDHVPGCAYVPASAGSPCTHEHDESCGGLPAGDEADPEPTEDPAPTESPELPEDPDGGADGGPAEGDERPGGLPEQDGPTIDGEPSIDGEEEEPGGEDDEIAPIALSDAVVTVKQSAGTDTTEITSGTTAELTWEYNQVWKLDISADFNGVSGARQVKISVAPGLRIVDYYNGESSNFTQVETSLSESMKNLQGQGYTPPQNYDTVTYTVSDSAATVTVDLNLAVDTVLWPKVNGWKIENAIQVEITGGGAPETRTAQVTVNRGTVAVETSWNQLYCSDSNNSVPGEANKDFRMKTMQVATNLHDSALGMYYSQLILTVPLPQAQKDGGGGDYAKYIRVETAPGTTPAVSTDNTAHTVTFTWNNLYVPAGNNLTVTPYFQWETAQTDGATVKFSDPSKFSVQATAYQASSDQIKYGVSGTLTDPKTTFTVRGNVHVTVNGQFRSKGIYNYGNTDQVYQLGQFQVRNDGFGDTGELTLEFDYSASMGIAHVTAQRIPLKAGGVVKSITYTTNKGTPVTVTPESDSKYYYRTGTYQSYLLMAPEGEYFTSITATVDGYGPQYVGYNSSASESPNNGCVTYGKMAAPDTIGSYTASLTISGGGLSGDATNSFASTITRDSKQTTQMKVEPAGNLFTFQGEKTNKVQLGIEERARTVHFSGYISATDYPYTNNQVVDRPVIYIRLPNAIEVKTVALYSSQTDYNGAVYGEDSLIDPGVYTFSGPENRGGDGYHVYKIEFNNDGSYSGAIGCFNGQLGQTRLRLDFDMVADVKTEDVILKMCDTVFVGYADGSAIESSGSLASNQKQDTHNVDGDENTGEYFSTMTDTEAYRLELEAPRIGLTFNSYAKLSTETEENYKNFKEPADNVESLTADGHIMYITGETLAKDDAGIDFRFTAENKTGAPLSIKSSTLGSEDFYYYIPVPKIGNNWDPHIQDEAFDLSLTLKDEVTVSGDGGLVEVRYSTRVDASHTGTADPFHYNNASAVESNYQSWESIDDPNNIRMIRISVRQDTAGQSFPVNYKASFEIHYKFAEEDKNELVGQYIEFGPCGITSYVRNNASASGHTPTQRIRAEIQTGSIAGRVFLDSNFNGAYDEDERLDYDTSLLTISAQHKAGADPGMDPDTTTHTAAAATDGTYELTGLQARTYTVTAVNGAYSEGAPTDSSRRFSAVPKEGRTGYLPETSFDVKVDGTAENRQMNIGLQAPHKVTFKVEYVDEYSSSTPAAPTEQTVYVWHNTTLTGSGVTIPDFSLDSDFRWESGDYAVWTAEEALDANSTRITGDVTYTATAVRKEHSVNYDLNVPDGYTQGTGVPGAEQAVNGQSVTLKCVNGDVTGKPSVTGSGDKVVFIGWAADENKIIYNKGSGKEASLPALLTSVTMQDRDVTVYALWGYDTNGNGTADVLEDRYTVTYYAGLGSNPPEAVTNLLVDEEITLDSGDEMNPPVVDGVHNILFVGWKETNPEKIYSKDDIADKSTIDSGLHVPGEYTVTESVDLYALWTYDENNNKTPDYREVMHALKYDANGVSPHPGDYPADADYLPDTEVTLWKPLVSWTGTRSSQKVIFVGWSESRMEPVRREDPKDSLVDQVTVLEEDKTVYAVWALDTNNNDRPDYEEDWYTLSYDKNEGTGTDPVPDSVDFLPGSRVTLANTDSIKWTRTASDGKPAILVGWSLKKAEVFDQDGIATAGGEKVDLAHNTFKLTSPYLIEAAEDTTLYAIYAVDDNGDGEPDYSEDAWQVYYYANGGKALAPGVTVEDDGLFRKCGHHHVAGEPNVSLIDLDTGRGLIQRENAVLLGWSLNETVNVVKSEEEKDAAAITETVNIPAEAVDDNRYVQVYAVWAEDLNGNHVADYTEDRLNQWYYYNKALNEWIPTGLTNDETDEAGKMDELPSGVNEVRFAEGAGLPGVKSGILPGTTVNVPDASLKERWDYDAEGNELHHYIQLGWSGFCHPAASSAEQALSWLHKDEDPAEDGTQRKVVNARYQYNFAVWAPDDNDNSIPDYNEGHFNLTFNLKGGSGGPSNRRSVLEGITVPLSPAPTKDRALFLGWSEKDLCAGGDLTAAPTETLLDADAEWTMPGRDTTLYAVWAVDRDGNSVADYEQTVTVTYHDNAKSGGSVSNMPEPRMLGVSFSDQSLVLSKLTPTHTKTMAGQDLAFIAWSTERTSSIYSRYDQRSLESDAPAAKRFAPGSTFPLPADAGNVDLYAVWGYDLNGINGADVLEPRYTLTYDVNGGSFAPSSVSGRLEGDRVELNMEARHDRDNVILVGWTTPEDKVEEILTWDNAHSRSGEIDSRIMTEYTMGAGDATVYAVWAEDLNGNTFPDYRENKSILTYHYTGADTPEGLVQGGGYLPGLTATLWADANTGTDGAWSRGEGSGRSVFVGWTLSEETAGTVLSAAPGPRDTVREVVMAGDVNVYALWAWDRNANGIPDYSEARITLTLDPNGGMNGTEEAASLYLTDLLPGTYTGLALEKASAWTKTVDGLKLAFAGWSDTPLDGYIDSDGLYRDAARAGETPAEKILLPNPYQVPAENRTLYAVYAADEDGDGRPDSEESAVHVEYYANGGTAASGKWLNDTEELFYICAHRHAPGETETKLLTTEQAAAYISRPGALLVGWGLRPAGLCLTKAQVAAALAGTVTLPAAGHGNARLYAVWAVDENGSGIPDYQETAAGPVGSLAVTKTVQGRAGEEERQWHFRVELSDSKLSGLYGDLLFTDGAAEFSLRHGQTATAAGLPAGLKYTVTEQEAGKDGYTTKPTGETGTIPEGETARASFVNSRETVPPAAKTGDDGNAGYWLGLMLLSAMGFLLTGTPVLQRRPRRAVGKHERR